MKKEIAITDITRMQEGRVCVAGYDRHGNCFRPVLPHPDPGSVHFEKKLGEDQKRDLLIRTQSDSVKKIFEVPIKTGPGFYIQNCQGVRSLGTIRPVRVLKAIYEQDNSGKWKYRIGFVDGDNESYWLTITGLTWRYYCDHQRNSGIDPKHISYDLTSKLRIRETYLRIGLARGWEKFPDRCYLQITGVYTFPDHLDGKTFADFAPEPGEGLS
jgi:hypothetical protein